MAMLKLKLDDRCVNCGNCYWLGNGEFHQMGEYVIDERELGVMLEHLLSKCHLDCITYERIPVINYVGACA